MKRRVWFIFAILTMALAGGAGCDRLRSKSSANPPGLERPLADLKKWVDSLSGLTIAEVKGRLAPARPVETTWSGKGKTGPKLEYSLAEGDLEIYCHDDCVVMVSIDVFPK